MKTVNTREWSAWINIMPGTTPTLYVKGEVETNAGNIQPKLMEKVPQGFNPMILLLDLSLVTSGDVGTDDVAFRPVHFEKPAKKGQYTQVQVLYEGDDVETMNVEEAH